MFKVFWTKLDLKTWSNFQDFHIKKCSYCKHFHRLGRHRLPPSPLMGTCDLSSSYCARRFEISAKLAKCQCYFWNLRNIFEYETSMSPKHFTITVQIWRLWQEREFERHVRQGATEKSASSALIWVRHRTAVLSCAIHRSAHWPRCAIVRVLGNWLMPKIAISFKGSLTARHTNGNEDLERSKSWSNRVHLFTPNKVQPHQPFACGM